VTTPDRGGLPGGGLFVLVAGWPGSGKSTLAGALAPRMGLPLLAKDEIKEALMDALGAPVTVADSQRLGRAAGLAMLRAARAGRHAGHLDAARSDQELWGGPPRSLGLGPVVEVDTSGPVDIPQVAATVTGLVEVIPRSARPGP